MKAGVVWSIGWSLCFLAGAAGRSADADVLLHDSFVLTAPNPNTKDVNFQIATRQSGTLAPLTYTKGEEPTFSQVGNSGAPNALLLAGRAAGSAGAVSIDEDFSAAPGVGNAFVIAFDVNPVQVAPGFNVTQSSWITVDFGATTSGRNDFPQYTDGIGLLFRGNGGTQAFDHGTFLGNGSYAPGADDLFHHIRIEVFDAGDGNPFDGNGSPVTVRAFADESSVPFFSYQRATGFTSNYLSLLGEGEGSGGDNVVRHELTNLDIRIEPIPEPQMLMPVVIAGAAFWARRRR